MHDEEIWFLGEEGLVAGAGGGVEDVGEEGGGGEAGAGKEDGEGLGEVDLAEEGFEGGVEKFLEALESAFESVVLLFAPLIVMGRFSYFVVPTSPCSLSRHLHFDPLP